MSEVSDMIQARLNGPAGDPMIRYHGQWLNRGWIRDLVAELDQALDALDLPPDAPIGFAPETQPEFIAGLLALIARQRPIVMIYAYQSSEALARKLSELSLPAVIAGTGRWTGAMLDAARAIGTAAIGLSRSEPGASILSRWSPKPGVAYRRAPEARGIELLTSGTTGPPKLFPMSYERLFGRMVLGNSTNNDDRAPALLYFPLGNIAGVYILMPLVAADKPIIVLDKFEVAGWLDYVRQVRPVSVNLPPAAFRMILDAEVDPAEIDFIRYIVTGAATLDPTLRRDFEARYGTVTLQSYGATEFGGVVSAVLPEHIEAFGRTKSDSVGRPWASAKLRIVDVETGNPLPPNEEGRIEVLSPIMSDAWITTTDLGMIDTDGFLYHRGRLDGAIMRGGFKIIPEQVAETLAAHPSVAAAAVIGLADARLGQVPAAAIQLRNETERPSEAELERHLRDRLPATMIPTRYLFVEALPRTPSLKVDMLAVAALFE